MTATHYLLQQLEARLMLAGSIAGQLYIDSNNNAARDEGEAGLSKFSVYLDLNNDGLHNPDEPQQKPVNGTYVFSDLSAGTHIIRFVPDAFPFPNYTYYAQIDPPDYAPHVVTISEGENADGVDFRFGDSAGVVGAVVVNDENANGIKDGAEQFIPGTWLYADLNQDGQRQPDEPLVHQQGTGSPEVFLGLAPGTYHIRAIIPLDFSQIAPVNHAPLVAQVADNQQVGGTIALQYNYASISGNVAKDYQYFYLEPTFPPPASPSIVYLDLDNDGARGVDEPFQTLDSQGNYQFNQLDPGSYTVRLENLAGWTITQQPGSAVVLVKGKFTRGVNFHTIRGDSSISGLVYEDRNRNGVVDPGEAPADRVNVILEHTTGFIHRVIYSVERMQGNFAFHNLRPGSYKLRLYVDQQHKPVNPPSGELNIDLAMSQILVGQNVGYRKVGGNVTFHLFEDQNMDGYRVSSEPGVSGFTVYQDLNDNLVRDSNEPFAVSDNYGDVFIPDVADYLTAYRVELPPGWRTCYGTPDGVLTKNLRAGWSNHEYLYPLVQTASSGIIRGGAFNDQDGDKVRDPGETGEIMSFWLDINGNKQRDNTEPLVQQSDSYEFKALPAGVYTVYAISSQTRRQTSPGKQTGIAVNLQLGGLVTNPDFAVTTQANSGAVIRGVVFRDIDRDGVQDADESGRPVSTVYLDADNDRILDPGEQFTFADPQGNFTFVGLAAGTYKVRQLLPPGYEQILPANNFGLNYTLSSNQVSSIQRFATADNLPPVLTLAYVDFTDHWPPAIRFSFNEGMSTLWDRNDLHVENLNTGAVLPTGQFLLNSYEDAQFNYRMWGTPASIADGNYRVTLDQALVKDTAGNQISHDVVIDFFYLAGDGNQDRIVDTQDFNLLAKSFGVQTGVSLTRGDYNGDGAANSMDFAVLIAQYGKRLAPLAAAASTLGIVASQSPSPFSDSELDHTLESVLA